MSETKLAVSYFTSKTKEQYLELNNLSFCSKKFEHNFPFSSFQKYGLKLLTRWSHLLQWIILTKSNQWSVQTKNYTN